MENRWKYVVILALLVPVTLVLHFYSELPAALPGQSSLTRHVLADLCYIPIVLAAIWFGLRGAVITTTFIAGFSFLFLLLNPPLNPHEIISDYVEIIFFYLVGAVSGVVLDRDRRLRRMLADTQRNLDQAERLSIIGQMVASIVHEFKNPLVSIAGAARIIREKSLAEDKRDEYLTVIEEEAGRLDKAVRQLLSYPRPGPPNLAQIDVREPLLVIQKQLGMQCEIQGVKITLKCPDIPRIWGDRDRLYHAFSNIIINAMQALPQGGKIELSCRVASSSGRVVVVEIMDNGPGISKDIQPKIFQPFFSTKSDGTGLGLAIAKTIIREHGGAIEIESVEGRGTKFIVTLPVENTILHKSVLTSKDADRQLESARELEK